MAKLVDLTNQRFGRLVVLARDLSNKRVSWLCRCECGTTKTVYGGSLKRGATTSCGCRGREVRSDRIKANTTHGQAANGGTRTFHIWNHMRARCTNPKHPAFDDYGGRGISVCDRWLNSFENFRADMGDCPPGLSIDRFPNNDGNYEPGNCRWATPREQALNRRRRRNNANSRRLTYRGETRTLRDWAEVTGIKWATLWYRLNSGMSIERILAPPLKQHDARRISCNGENLTIREWSSRLNIPIHTIYTRLRRGESPASFLS